MTPEEKLAAEKAAMLKEIETQVKSLITESQKEGVSKADLDAKVAEINKTISEKLDNAGMKSLEESVQKLITATSDNAAAIKALTEKGIPKSEGKKTFREAVKAAIMEHEGTMLKKVNDDNGERLSMKDYLKSNRSPEIVVKDAVDMLESAIVGANVATVRLTELDPQRVGIPLTVYPHVIDVFPSKTLNKAYMSVLVAYTYVDGAGTKTEGSAPGKSSFLLKTVEFKAFYVSTFFTLSDETLDDLNEAVDEIALVAPDKILSQIDAKIFADAGDGATDIKGLLVGGDNCTDFVAATYEKTVAGANKIDLIAKMKLAVRKNKYAANFVGLNSTDIDEIQSLKDLLNNSVADKRLVFNANGDLVKIAGLTVVENDAITANTCIVGATDKCILGIRKAMTMEIGYNAADFTEGQKTVKMNIRLAFGVRDKAAFQYSSDMATDLETIAKASV